MLRIRVYKLQRVGMALRVNPRKTDVIAEWLVALNQLSAFLKMASIFLRLILVMSTVCWRWQWYDFSRLACFEMLGLPIPWLLSYPPHEGGAALSEGGGRVRVLTIMLTPSLTACQVYVDTKRIARMSSRAPGLLASASPNAAKSSGVCRQ